MAKLTGGETSQLPTPSNARLYAAQHDKAFEIDKFINEASDKNDTVLYLAYGSNLSIEKFRKSRGIKPLAQVNVQVPSLRLTFDLPGIPYAEPCFANSGLQNSADEREPEVGEKAGLVQGGSNNDYRKNRWHKGLIGVVYEVTPKDYAHIIATEGGGASYKDIVVDCYPFASSDPTVSVPIHPTTSAFKAHTLYAPALPAGSKPPANGGRIARPNPGFAQPSARYLKLITDGAAELRVPYEYQDYLQSIRPFTITTYRQRLGQVLLLSFWGPIVLSLFGLSRLVSDKEGRVPQWLGRLLSLVFATVWRTYDGFFKSVFGEGERTVGDARDGGQGMKFVRGLRRRISSVGGTRPTTDLEGMTAMQR